MYDYIDIIRKTSEARLEELDAKVDHMDEPVIYKALALDPGECRSLFQYSNDTIEEAERLVSLLINGLFDDSNLHIKKTVYESDHIRKVMEDKGFEYKPLTEYHIIQTYSPDPGNSLEPDQVIEIMKVWTKYRDFYNEHEEEISKLFKGNKMREWKALYPACVEVMEKYL